MDRIASSIFSDEPDSLDAGRAVARELVSQFEPGGLKAVLAYATMNHEQQAVLEGLREGLGKDTLLLGCSVQGVVSNDELTEDGFALGVMGFGGADIDCAIAIERTVQEAPRDKGRRLAQALKKDLKSHPKAVILHYDPLCGIDVESLLEGFRLELDCPIIGGAAGQPWGPPRETFQYYDREVLSHSALALAITGNFEVEMGICHGTAPVGIASVITKAAGQRILEIDGRPAVDVWRQTTGCSTEDLVHQGHLAAWAVGVELVGASGQVERAIRGAFGFEPDTGALILQAPVAEGTKVMLQHRTIDRVLNGTRTMAAEMATRLSGRTPRAVLGFECAARTFPFLGEENTRAEHQGLRADIAPHAPWLGMMAWGEIGPCAGRAAFHNYTYPLLVLTESRA
jgi:hypothetical protein